MRYETGPMLHMPRRVQYIPNVCHECFVHVPREVKKMFFVFSIIIVQFVIPFVLCDKCWTEFIRLTAWFTLLFSFLSLQLMLECSCYHTRPSTKSWLACRRLRIKRNIRIFSCWASEYFPSVSKMEVKWADLKAHEPHWSRICRMEVTFKISWRELCFIEV